MKLTGDEVERAARLVRALPEPIDPAYPSLSEEDAVLVEMWSCGIDQDEARFRIGIARGTIDVSGRERIY